ncbi:MAG: M67 family metallopeptidase [Bacteroidota bacterium]
MTVQHRASMRSHVSALAPLEACGLLAGKAGRVEAVLPVTNQACSPTRFIMEPVEQLKAFEWIEDHGLELLGVYHSHPAGPEGMSATDRAEAAYDVVHVIWSRPRGVWKPRAYRLLNGQAREVQLELRDGE